MDYIPTPLWRRLLIIIYDSVLVFGVLYLALFPVVAVAPELAKNRLFTLVYSLCAAWLYFAWFWVKPGQTLGMKTWRVRVLSVEGKNIGWKQASVRFLVALLSWTALGMGFLWSLFDGKKRTWHDMASNSVLLQSSESDQ